MIQHADTKRTILLPFFILASHSLQAQRSEKLVDLTFTPTSLFFTNDASPLALLPSLEVGLNFTLSEKIEFCVSNAFNLSVGELAGQSKFNKLRIKSIYQLREKNDQAFLGMGLEYTYTKNMIINTDNYYRFEGNEYRYEEAEIHQTFHTASYLFNLSYHFADRWAFDFTSGLGARFVELEAKNQFGLQQVESGSSGYIFIGIGDSARRMGTHTRLHLPLQFTLRYALIKSQSIKPYHDWLNNLK